MESGKSISIKAIISTLAYIITPLLFGLYPVLFFYASNIQEVAIESLVTPVKFVVLSTLGLLVLAWAVLRSGAKAALFTTIFWVFFFFYGRLFTVLDTKLPENLSKHSYVMGAAAVLLLIIAGLLWRTRRITPKVLQAVLVMGLVMVGLQLFSITSYSAKQADARASDNAFEYLENPPSKVLSAEGRAKLPDIYYLMLDSYPRTDTLKEYFGYDNSPFDHALKERGFFIASKSHSNYNHTVISVPSLLNMSYIVNPPTDPVPQRKLFNLYHNNKVLEFLKGAGYRYVNNSNLYSTLNSPVADLNIACGSNNEFLTELANTTALLPLGEITDQTRKNKRADALCVMEHMSGKASGGSPKMVFSHLLPPHPPFLFGENGEDVEEINLSLDGASRWQTKEPYVAQLKYLNKRIEQAVDEILAHTPDAIIMLGSDHGTYSSTTLDLPLNDTAPRVLTERSRNIIAVRLPDFCDRSHLYDQMSNVNVFRSVFNGCFGADYERLPDKVFYVPRGTANFKNFQDITETVGE